MRIGIIGNGRLGTALAEGFRRDGRHMVYLAYRSRPGRLEGVEAVRELPPVDVAILAVKPQDVDEALRQHRSRLEGTPLVSTAAGVRLARLAEQVDGGPLARAMPNICAAVGASTTVLCVQDDDLEGTRLVEEVFGALGRTTVVPCAQEAQLDAVTALSGSGPAYVYEVLHALAEAGTALGLDPELARALAVETVRGAAALAADRPAVPLDQLVRQVASPGGTTEAALGILHDGDLKGLLGRAVAAAARRSATLG
jgi:pyrroline-5-carboxylate reductase